MSLGSPRLPRPANRGEDPPWEALRERMVRQDLAGGSNPIRNPRVLDAMARVPRHLFVPGHPGPDAYADYPLQIGCRQTISQPYIVALMTELLEPHAPDRILEIGTGSGYQTAVLAQLVAEVFTLEIIPALAERARLLFDQLALSNVHTRVADGALGWPDAAPFDGIIVTCAPEELPLLLTRQLREGGRMVIPVGPPDNQQLLRLRLRNGRLESESHCAVRFVPMTGLALATPE